MTNEELNEIKKYLASEIDYDSEAIQIYNLTAIVNNLLPLANKNTTLEQKIQELSEKYNGLIGDYNRLVDLYKAEKERRVTLETIMKDKAKRARKLPKDHTGYICHDVREVSEKYSVFDSYNRRTYHYTATAYRSTFQTPYYSAYGFDEIRRLLIDDIVNRYLGEEATAPHKDSLAHAVGIDYVIGAMAADGAYPNTESEKNFLYRAVIKLGKEYAEVDLYTTAPLRLSADPYKPVKNKGQE